LFCCPNFAWRWDFETNPIVFCSVEPNQPNRELPDPDALPCVLSDRAPCFGVLPKSGSETLLLCAIFLPVTPLFSAISLIDCTEADGINDDMVITDWLFTNFAAAGAE
jgi:hypothetical protein